MMKRFPITSESSTVKEFPRCPCGMGWTPIRPLPSCIRWSPSFPSQVKHKEYVLRPDTWLSLCLSGYSRSEYKLNYLIPLVTIQNQVPVGHSAQSVSVANHRSWLVNKAPVEGTAFWTLVFWKTWGQVGLLGFPKRGPRPILWRHWGSGESRGGPVYLCGLRATLCLTDIIRPDFLDGLTGQL